MYADTNNIKETIQNTLAGFERIGIAHAHRFDTVNASNHPAKYMSDFKSVIVYAEGQKDSTSGMNGFADYLGSISAQSEVLDYLHNMGFKAFVVDGNYDDLSLVRMGIEAGIGEISPVDSLVVKGLGLTATLGAIVTNASIEPDETIEGICVKCNKCLRVCPIREIANESGNLSKCACGNCRHICPV
ncbi:hypothetical protein [Carboxylicivirga marina]|uniref:hypothetical protein n=1 Tax=Carboxylicivirga marina TaxID=2800988 RepID=UPI00259A1595|nr:hypothetical protein [uncultured Carboxylicivirga sp.]